MLFCRRHDLLFSSRSFSHGVARINTDFFLISIKPNPRFPRDPRFHKLTADDAEFADKLS